MYYKKEEFPKHIKFVKDTPKNRRLLEEKIGENSSIICDDYSYIEINTKDNTWRNCLSFEWLYRNPPPLISIKEVINSKY
jgi:hypothetical protein